MTKKLSAIVLALAFLSALSPAVVIARQVNNPSSATPDAWAVHGGNCYSGGFVAGCEVAVDYNGNLLPTTANAQTLGTLALPWSTVYTQNVSATSNATVNGLLILPSTNVTVIGTATQIPATTSYEDLVVVGNGNITLTSLPSIQTVGVANGTVLILSTVGTPTVGIQDNGTLANSGVRLDTTVAIIKSQRTLTLIYDSGDKYWHMIGYGVN